MQEESQEESQDTHAKGSRDTHAIRLGIDDESRDESRDTHKGRCGIDGYKCSPGQPGGLYRTHGVARSNALLIPRLLKASAITDHYRAITLL
jgi:hypothetical protein